MTKVICSTFKGGAEQGGAAGQTGLAPPPYRPPLKGGAVRVEQERSRGGAVETAETLVHLAARVDHLTVSHRDPEAFFVERSEIADALRRAARRVPPPCPPAGRERRGVSLACLDLAPKVRGGGG